MRDRIGEKQLGIDPLEGVAPACPRILSTERSKVDRKRRPDGFQPGYFSGLLGWGRFQLPSLIRLGRDERAATGYQKPVV